jgi:hypothetical protein
MRVDEGTKKRREKENKKGERHVRLLESTIT